MSDPVQLLFDLADATRDEQQQPGCVTDDELQELIDRLKADWSGTIESDRKGKRSRPLVELRLIEGVTSMAYSVPAAVAVLMATLSVSRLPIHGPNRLARFREWLSAVEFDRDELQRVRVWTIECRKATAPDEPKRQRRTKGEVERAVYAAIAFKMQNPEWSESRCADEAGIPVSTLNGHPLWQEWQQKIDAAHANGRPKDIRREWDKRLREFTAVDPDS